MPGRHWIKALLLGAFFYCASAWAEEAQPNVPHPFPGTATILQDGDIILNDGLNIVSSFNRQFGYPLGLYTHASIYIELPKEGGRIIGFNDAGIQVSKPEAMLGRNFRLALLRPRVKPPAGALAAAFQALSGHPLKFDYDMKWPSADSNTTYCAGFISQLFRLAGLAEIDPFPQPAPRAQDYWDGWAQQHLGLQLDRINSPNTPLLNPNFQVLAEYQEANPRLRHRFWINDATMRRMMDYIRTDQRDVAPPKLGSRLALAAAKAGLVDGVGFIDMPGPRQRVFIAIYEFMLRVEARVKRSMILNEDQTWDEPSIRALTVAVADAYRDEFFVPPSPH